MAVRPDVVQQICARPEVTVAADVKALERELADADGLIIQDPAWSPEIAAIAAKAPALKWLQLLTSGYDKVLQFGAPEGIAITNARGVFSPAVAVHAVSLYLALLRNVPQMVAQKGEHAWERGFAAGIITPAETRVLIAGFGSIGAEIARLLQPFGVHVTGANRSGTAHPLADEMIRGGDFHAHIGSFDAIFLCMPLDEGTRNLIDSEALSRCRKNAVIVNIGRGGLIDSRALAKALHNGQISGAAVDVTEPEPLPAYDPLWDAPNLIISPHVAGAAGAVGGKRQAQAALVNLQLFSEGKPLQNVVEL